MENFSFYDYLIIVFCCWFVYRAILVSSRRAELRAEVRKEIKNNVVIAWLEKHNEGLFLYNKTTSQFIAQAVSEDELKLKLKQVFPNIAFIVVDQNMANE